MAMNEPTLDELSTNVLRNAGWIMTGGSAQFLDGALSEMQSGLHQIGQRAASERVLGAVKVLSEKATGFVKSKASDTASIMTMRRIVEEFEQAMKAYLKTAGKR
jgi:hypothetical protein